MKVHENEVYAFQPPESPTHSTLLQPFDQASQTPPSLTVKSLGDSDYSPRMFAPAGASSNQPCFPQNFMKGVGLSVYQNSPDHSSNWNTFVRRKNYLGQGEYKEAWEKGSDFWNRYEEDIKSAKEQVGTTSFRFSFEWARFEPKRPGKFDEAAVIRFHQIVDCIRVHGMEPMVTMHHFTHPQWFEERGGFEKEDNIPLFLDYCKRLFEIYSPKVTLWATFNEPACYSFVGYVCSIWCPGHFLKFKLAGQVLLNLLKAHVTVWKALKAMPRGAQACVGLVHQHIAFMPKEDIFYLRSFCKWMTYFFASETILRFFKTGEFEWKVPFSGALVKYSDPTAVGCLDWWGINYYSRPSINWWLNMGAGAAKEPVSDMKFRVYPQGLYDSIVDASVLNKPIFITETGVADKHDTLRRGFIESHFPMILKAMRDGYDVRGVYYWTLMDNMEWHEGFRVKFGLMEWDPIIQRTKGLKLRAGSHALGEVYKSWPNSLHSLKAHAILPGEVSAGGMNTARSAANIKIGIPNDDEDDEGDE